MSTSEVRGKRQVRMTGPEWERITEAARQIGEDASKFIRRAALAEAELALADRSLIFRAPCPLRISHSRHLWQMLERDDVGPSGVNECAGVPFDYSSGGRS